MTSQAPERDVAKVVVVAVGLLLAAIAVGTVVRSVTGGDRAPEAVGRVLLVETGSDSDIRVTFELAKDPGATAECDIGAFDAKGKSVGRLIGVPIAASATGERTSTQTVTVPTPLGTAATAAVATCRVTRPG